MNIFNLPLEVLNPPALHQQAFDEERALAEIKVLTEQRDEGKAIYQGARVQLGQKLLEARRAMPDVAGLKGLNKFSVAFIGFVEKTGLSLNTAKGYMSFARNPNRIEEARQRVNTWRKTKGGSSWIVRLKALTEIRDALLGNTKEDVLAAINEELANHGNA